MITQYLINFSLSDGKAYRWVRDGEYLTETKKTIKEEISKTFSDKRIISFDIKPIDHYFEYMKPRDWADYIRDTQPKVIGTLKNLWRQRFVYVFEHPYHNNMVITIGFPKINDQYVIGNYDQCIACVEPKELYKEVIDAHPNTKVYK